MGWQMRHMHWLPENAGKCSGGLQLELRVLLRLAVRMDLEFVVAVGLGALHTFFSGGRDLMNSKIMAWASFLTRGGISPFTITLRN